MNWSQVTGNWKQFAGSTMDKWDQRTNDGLPSTVVEDSLLAPLQFIPVAKWVSEAKTAVAVNGNGEILVFHDEKRKLCRKRGHWGYFAAETIVTPLASKAPVKVSISDVLHAVYGTLLDASSAGNGGGMNLAQEVINPGDEDIVSKCGAQTFSSRRKLACIRKLLEDKHSFANIDTVLRQEIAALDGLAVLTCDVKLLPIPLIKKTLSENGRPGAAQASRKSGIHIRVSNDGYPQVFANGHDGPCVSFV